MTTIIIIVILVLLVVAYVMMYNGLVNLRTHAQEAWSQIDVQLQRRNDLIPNLLETVKGYSKYEAATLEKVTSLRTQLASLPDDAHQEKMDVSNRLTQALGSVYAVAENYPDLKASTEYTKLMEELSNPENKIAYARQLYNSTVATFDARIKPCPAIMLDRLTPYTPMYSMRVPEGDKDPPRFRFH